MRSKTLPDSEGAGSWGLRGRLVWLPYFPGRGWAACSSWGLHRENGLQLSRKHCQGCKEMPAETALGCSSAEVASRRCVVSVPRRDPALGF